MAKGSSDCINLQLKKLKIMADIAGIAKKGKNAHQKYNYIAVDDVLNAFRSAFIKHKVSFHNTLESWHQFGSGLLIVVKMKIINAENPEDWESYNQVGISVRLDDTSVGKALAYAVKNGLLKVFLIPGGKGEDVEYYDNKPVTPKEIAPAPVANPTAQEEIATIIEAINEADSIKELQATWIELKTIYPKEACKEAYPIYLTLKQQLSPE